MIEFLAQNLLPTLLIVAAISDAMTYRIPNWLNVLIFALFFPMAWLVGMSWTEMGTSFAVALGLLAIGIGLFQFGLIGGGDAKMLAAVGIWFGYTHFYNFLVLSAIAGGFIALVLVARVLLILLRERKRGERFSSLWAKYRENKPGVPYALAFAVGGILAFKNSGWMVGFS